MRFTQGILGVGLSALLVGSFGVGCNRPAEPVIETPITVADGMQAITLNVKGMT